MPSIYGLTDPHQHPAMSVPRISGAEVWALARAVGASLRARFARANRCQSSVLHFPRRHVGVKQALMQPAEFLTQVDQFMLVAFVLPAQDLSQQGTCA